MANYTFQLSKMCDGQPRLYVVPVAVVLDSSISMLHEQPDWVDHCSCMPRGSGDLLHRQQADFLNMPRSSARRDSTFQQPGPARPVCFTVIDVLSSRCAAAPLRPAPLRCCAAPPLHPVWISCPRRGISFLWRRSELWLFSGATRKSKEIKEGSQHPQRTQGESRMVG